MAKRIAVWGSPNCGKTTFSQKLARSIYDEYKSTVIVLFCDYETPVLPLILPNYKSEELYSVGDVLSKADISLDDVVKDIVILKGKQNFGFLGFKYGENKYTYPEFNENKVMTLYNHLDSLADYIIVDCTSNLTNLLSNTAVKDSDIVIRLASPDLKSLCWYSSQLSLYKEQEYKLDAQIQGLNVPNADLFMPVDDIKAHLPNLQFVLPYSSSVKQQLLDGTLCYKTNDKKYNNIIQTIVEKII